MLDNHCFCLGSYEDTTSEMITPQNQRESNFLYFLAFDFLVYVCCFTVDGLTYFLLSLIWIYLKSLLFRLIYNEKYYELWCHVNVGYEFRCYFGNYEANHHIWWNEYLHSFPNSSSDYSTIIIIIWIGLHKYYINKISIKRKTKATRINHTKYHSEKIK